jgi:hypothetical protein
MAAAVEAGPKANRNLVPGIDEDLVEVQSQQRADSEVEKFTVSATLGRPPRAAMLPDQHHIASGAGLKTTAAAFKIKNARSMCSSSSPLASLSTLQLRLSQRSCF